MCSNGRAGRRQAEKQLADPSPGLPSLQGARPFTHVAAGAPRPIGVAPGRCSCPSSSCMYITHTCLRHPARISRAAPPTCALCSASTKILGVGTTSATGKLRPRAREPFRVLPGWAEPDRGRGFDRSPRGEAEEGPWRWAWPSGGCVALSLVPALGLGFLGLR